MLSDDARSERGEQHFWATAHTLYRRRRFIALITGCMAVAAVAVSLLLPNWYQASTRLLLPSGGSGSMLSMLENISPLARGLFGGGGDHTRYFAILSSRAVAGSVVDRFALIEVYETQNEPGPREAAIEMLLENAEFTVDQEYEYLAVSVLDTDPQRAADVANFFVAELNRVNSQLSSLSASNFHSYVENRYAEAQASLDSLLDAAQSFQQQYGVFDLPVQAEGFFTQVAALRAQATRAEIEYEALLNQYGPQNTQVQAFGDIARAANRKYAEALAGQEALMPVARADMPGVLRQYVDLEREVLIQRTILETVAPVREQARFDVERTVEAVQVIDEAIPPAEKAKPRRSIIVIAATISAFLLAVIYALSIEWMQGNLTETVARIKEGETPAYARREKTEV